MKYQIGIWQDMINHLMARWGSSALAGSLSSDVVKVKVLVVIQPYTYQPSYDMLQINEFNQAGPELPMGSVTVPETPSPEVLQVTSGVGVSKSPRKTTIYTRRKTRRISKNPRRKWEKSEYMNTLQCLLRAEKKGVKKGIGKILHDFWTEKGMWENDEPNKNDQNQKLGNKYRNRNIQEKNRQQR